MNEHTGQAERTKPASEEYREGWERIFCRHDRAYYTDPVQCMDCGKRLIDGEWK